MRKLTTIGILSAVTLLAASVSAKEEVDITKLPAPAAKQVDFVKEIRPLLEASCVKCHGGERPKARYQMDNRENVLKGGNSKEAAIIPGNSAKSPLVLYIAELVQDMEMPPVDSRDKYPLLTKEQVSLVRAWIDQGAKWEP